MVQLWPPVDIPRTLTRSVWNSDTARAIPGVGRALGIYGLLGNVAMDAYRGAVPLPRPRILRRPDPTWTRSGFVKAHIEDYLLNGNAAHLVTAYDNEGRPAACKWYPAHRWDLVEDRGVLSYYLDGRYVPDRDVIHSRRGADPNFPGRGVGVVEQHLSSLNRVGLQESAEAENLRGRGTPSVAVIVPQKDPKEEQLDAAANKWQQRFEGQAQAPVFLPNGTQVIPMGWSPDDQQMTEARKLSLTDVANMFNLDGYWLGAPASSHTYRTPGPLFVQLIRTSLNGVAVELEDEWSDRWLPRGQELRFDRGALTMDDLAASVLTAKTAYEAGLWDLPESRTYLGNDPSKVIEKPTPPAPPAPPEEAPSEELENEEVSA